MEVIILNKKKGFVAFHAMLIVAISLMFIAFAVYPAFKNKMGGITDKVNDNVLTVEKGNGSQVVDGNNLHANFVDSSVGVENDPSDFETVITSTRVYFENPKPTISTDEVFILRAIVEPENVSDNSVTWTILKGQDLAAVIRGSDSRNLEITGREPGMLVVQARTNDASQRIAYAYINIIQRPTSMSLDRSSITVHTSDAPSTWTTVTASVMPADTTDKSILWKFVDSNGAECINIQTNGASINIQGKTVAGVECNGRTVKMQAVSSDPTVYQELTINVVN